METVFVLCGSTETSIAHDISFSVMSMEPFFGMYYIFVCFFGWVFCIYEFIMDFKVSFIMDEIVISLISLVK